MEDNQVTIEVFDVGLNFKDVLIAMGQFPQEPFGIELSGAITAVGKGVTGFSEGDQVCAAPSSAFVTHKVCSANAIRKLPRGISNQEAASIPISFVTAYYSLVEVGKLRRGNTLLIHAAAKGEGGRGWASCNPSCTAIRRRGICQMQLC